MKKNTILSFALMSCLLTLGQQKNSLLDDSFWKKYPDVTAVKTEIEKGNNPAESNDRAFDPTLMAIMNDAPVATIKFLLEQPGNPVNKPTHDNRIYLHWAAGKGNLEIIQYLIEKGSDVNLEDSHSSFPITAAASSGQKNTAIYELFFKAGINPKKKYQDGTNLIHLSIATDNDLSLATYFATKGLSLKDVDNNGNSTINYVAKTGNIALIKKLIEKGIKYNNNALMFAAQGSRRESNTLEIYQYLINDLKLNPKTINNEGQTVLHYLATKPNQTEIINYFIAKGVDINKADNEGNTALMHAASAKEVGALKLLLPLVKNINIQNNKGESALTMAVKSGTPEAVSLLLATNANTLVEDKDGNNLGFYLIQSYRPQMGMGRGQENTKKDPFETKINLLQEKGLNLTTPQKDGNTLYHLALVKNDLSLLKKLAVLNIDGNTKNKDGLTPLHKAAMIAKDDVILKYLLTLGAKKEINTDFDESTYSLAKENETLNKNNISIDFLK